jgi:myosin heavy subunit
MTDEEIAKELLKKDAIIKDIQGKILLLRNALIEERKKTTELNEKNNELLNQISDLEKVISSKDSEITNITNDMRELQESILEEKNKSEEGGVKNVFNIFQKESNTVKDDENKKLQATVDELKEEREKIQKENDELKDNLNNLKNSTTKQINELKSKNNEMEQSIINKNKQIDDIMKQLEEIKNNNNQFENDKKNYEQTIINLENEEKTYNEELMKLNILNKNQKEKIDKIEGKIKEINENNFQLLKKMKTVIDGISEGIIVIQKFKCEKGNSKVEVTFGPTEDHQYIMYIYDYHTKKGDKYYIENIEYLKLNYKEKNIEISVMNKGICDRFLLSSNNIEILEAIVDTYEEYYNIIMRIKHNLTNIV